MSLWVFRNSGGHLWLTDNEPVRKETYFVTKGRYMRVDENMFPGVTFENSPRKVDFKMGYKVGDRVRIKSLDWYEKNKDLCGVVHYDVSGFSFPHQMSRFCGEVLTIEVISGPTIKMIEDNGLWAWHEKMIEGLAWSDEDEMKQMEEQV